jgi:hypothetical protein
MKYWEIVADKLSAAGWSWGYCSAVTRNGWRWIVTPIAKVAATLCILSNCSAHSLNWKRRGCDPTRLPVGHFYIQNTPQLGSTDDGEFVISDLST